MGSDAARRGRRIVTGASPPQAPDLRAASFGSRQPSSTRSGSPPGPPRSDRSGEAPTAESAAGSRRSRRRGEARTTRNAIMIAKLAAIPPSRAARRAFLFSDRRARATRAVLTPQSTAATASPSSAPSRAVRPPMARDRAAATIPAAAKSAIRIKVLRLSVRASGGPAPGEPGSQPRVSPFRPPSLSESLGRRARG